MRSSIARLLFFTVAVVALAQAHTTSAAGDTEQPSPRLMFLTSVSGSGDLSSWDGAGGKTGVDAGDAICQARATEANFANPGNFRAWLSDASDDAYCRIHDLHGKKSANCGQPSLPVSAGPWVRPDGQPFGPTIDLLLPPTRQVFYPPRIDEKNVTPPGTDDVHSGTAIDGSRQSTQDCNSWTSVVGNGEEGHFSETSDGWTHVFGVGATGGFPCLVAAHLLCFEIGAGPPLPVFQRSGVLAFATSATGTGNLSSWPQAGGATGIAAGDAICRALAASAHLVDPPRYKAWLSDSTTNAKDRFPSTAGPWVRPDGTHISDPGGLTSSGGLETTINQTETESYLGAEQAWTGTKSNGSKDSDACTDWTTAATGAFGELGIANAPATGSWTSSGFAPCNVSTAHLYCLAAVSFGVFADGFESGNTLAWSDTVGGP